MAKPQTEGGTEAIRQRPGTLALLVIGVRLIVLPIRRRRRAFARTLARQKGVADGS